MESVFEGEHLIEIAKEGRGARTLKVVPQHVPLNLATWDSCGSVHVYQAKFIHHIFAAGSLSNIRPPLEA
jgi:hypothetical protein